MSLPPGTYIIRVPNDQIICHPPPPNPNIQKRRTFAAASHPRPARRRCTCLRCFSFFLSLLIAVGVIYFACDPNLPKFTVDRLSLDGFAFNSTSPLTVNPEFHVTVRAENPNKNIGFSYSGKRSFVTVSLESNALCRGSLPSFDHGPRNVTVFKTDLIGYEIRLSEPFWKRLMGRQGRKCVPITVDFGVPFRAGLGGLISWTFEMKARCDLTVDKLGVDSRITSKVCRVYLVNFFFSLLVR
ncbi:hypothetical protein QJS10_CPB17g01520 [Acorus calamus]|uniref:Late embryogenesis abundant protein LEA-2 subgroup domain-containing protein n=1 Tax=Acorus calamus TaxID=4465 RepID=A0AAV9CXS7_ACOCL|nr:hypothetical protein QJS10_CPB17g01520 [Acorus calamus]